MVVEAIDIIACEILWPCPLFIDATPILALFFAAGWGGGYVPLVPPPPGSYAYVNNHQILM